MKWKQTEDTLNLYFYQQMALLDNKSIASDPTVGEKKATDIHPSISYTTFLKGGGERVGVSRRLPQLTLDRSEAVHTLNWTGSLYILPRQCHKPLGIVNHSPQLRAAPLHKAPPPSLLSITQT